MFSVLWNILPSSTVMKRTTFDKIGGFRDEIGARHPKWEDTYFMMEARQHGHFIYLDAPTMLYRVPSSVADGLMRRRMWNQGDARARVERYVGNSEFVQRLVAERFGDCAVRVIVAMRNATADLLVSIGLTAMTQGDRQFAREAYKTAALYRPHDLKNYLRLAWTYLPEEMARAASTLFPSKIRRAIAGPAQA
jgi:hypothetical protein